MRLQNGAEIPNIGFGTADMPAEAVRPAVLCALRSDCRFIDTAYSYGSESAVGDAVEEFIRAGGVTGREELFIQTKFYPKMPYGYKELRAQFSESLKALKLDYIDSYLIHQPVPRYSELEYQTRNADVWKAMEELYDQGKVRAIGVSNFLERHIMQIEEKCQVRPMINQLEIHPVFQQRGLAQWCKNRGMIVQSWGALGQGKIKNNEQIGRIAQKYHVSFAQICLRWNMQMGNIPIWASADPEHIRANSSLPFTLTEEEMETIRLCNTSTEHRSTWWYPRQQMY